MNREELLSNIARWQARIGEASAKWGGATICGKVRPPGPLICDKAIFGIFDEGCMGMYNALIDDELLNACGVYKERLSQSAASGDRRLPELPPASRASRVSASSRTSSPRCRNGGR